MPKTLKILPKWQNFAKSGHAALIRNMCYGNYSFTTETNYYKTDFAVTQFTARF